MRGDKVAARHWDEQALKRLGKLLEARREELDPRYHVRKVFAAERGIHLRKAADLENGWRGDFPPQTLKEEFAPAYGVTFESVLEVLEDDGDLVAAEGAPPHKPRDRRPATRQRKRTLPVIASINAAPGIGPYRAAVDAERDGWEAREDWDELTGDELRTLMDELWIWADPKLNEDEKRSLVAYRRLEWDKAVRSSQESAGLRRA
jgi:hypothetical protein